MAVKPVKTSSNAPSPLLVSLIDGYLTKHGLQATAKSLGKELRHQKRQLSGPESDLLKKNSLDSILDAWQSQNSTAVSELDDSSDDDTSDSASTDPTSTSDESDSEDEVVSTPLPVKKPAAVSTRITLKSDASISRKRKSPSLSSSVSSSDSDADDEDELPTKTIKTTTTKTKKAPAVSSQPILQAVNPLKRKPGSSSSGDSTSSSDSDSDEQPPAKRTKLVPSTKAEVIRPVTEDSSSESESESDSDSGSASSSESDSVADSDSGSDSISSSSEDDVMEDQVPENLVPAVSANSHLGSDSSSESSESSDEEVSAIKKVTIQKETVIADDDSAVVSTSSGTVIGNTITKPTVTTTVVKKRHEGARPTRLAALSANGSADNHVSNAYQSYEYADRAYSDLSVTRGKGFTKEKNKKKRGSYRGGAIDIGGGKGFKFEE